MSKQCNANPQWDCYTYMLEVDICDISTEKQQIIKAANMFSVQPHMSNFVQFFSTMQCIHLYQYACEKNSDMHLNP